MILSKDGENKSENVFLDWTDRDLVEKNFEEGLLGLALHPSFQENRLFYVGATRAKDHLHIIRPKDIYKGYKI